VRFGSLLRRGAMLFGAHRLRENFPIKARNHPSGPEGRGCLARGAAQLKLCPFKRSGSGRRLTSVAGVWLLLLGGAFALGSFGQAPTPVTAHEVAQRVDRHYDSLHTLKADFSESYAGLGVRRMESGTLLLRKPGRMRWNYTMPAGKIFLLDGKYAWFYAQGDAQVQRMPAKELDDLRSPLRFLLGKTDLEKEMNGLTLATAANGMFTLTGQPKGQEQRVARLTLTVTAEGAITGIELEETDGALTKFVFTNEQPNAPVPENAFQFTAPMGVPVVDAMPPV
jgi:outer membrane lipoprotein carrier protein